MTVVLGLAVLIAGAQGVDVPDLSSAEPLVREQISQRVESLKNAGDDRRARAEALAALAMTYHAYDLLTAAEGNYRAAIELESGQARWHYYLGLLLADRGEVEAATAAIEQALALAPDYLPGVLRLARLHVELVQLDEAERLYRRVLERDPREAEALFGMGQVAYARGHHAVAVEKLRASLDLAPQASATHYLLGLSYARQGRRDEARVHLDRGGELRASRPDPWLAELHVLDRGAQQHQDRGSALLEAGDLKGALDAFSRGVEARPHDPRVHHNLGTVRLRLGDVDGAIGDFRRALALDPNYPHAHFNLGTIFSKSGDEPSAIAQYQAALQADPAMVSARFNLGNALRRSGRYDESIEEYRRVLDAEPAHARARLHEALALVRLERYAEARERLEQGFQLLPDDPWLRQALVRVLAAAPDDTVRDGDRAVELAAGLAVAAAPVEQLEAYAMALAEAGRFDEAVGYQQGALSTLIDAGVADAARTRQLQANLELYENKRPCRLPWRRDGPELSPRSRRPPNTTP